MIQVSRQRFRSYLQQVKPHGAIYGQTSRSLTLARAMVEAVKVFNTNQDQPIALVGLAGTAHQTAAEEAGIQFIPGMRGSELC
jgi:lactam utilization protein B